MAKQPNVHTIQFPSHDDWKRLQALAIVHGCTPGEMLDQLALEEQRKLGIRIGIWDDKK